MAADVQHGISFTKGCSSPTTVGAPYSCSYTVQNNLDEAQDTLSFKGLVDTVHSAGGNISSGQLIGAVQITTTGGATCVAASGDGSVATPYQGVSSCRLPFGSRANILSYSFYTVQAGDFALQNHTLRDNATLSWNDLCDDPAGTGDSNCPSSDIENGAGSQAIVKQGSSTDTAIHNAAHAVVTTVPVGTTVHDSVTVTGQFGAVDGGRSTSTGSSTAPALAHRRRTRARSDRS